MDKIIQLIRMYIGGIVLNYVGASVRWTYGTIWRTIFNKPKFTFSEYVNGPNQSKDYFDQTGHQFNNKMIGGVAIFLILWLLLSIF